MKKINFRILLLLQAIFFIQTNSNAQILTTDKPDYPPLDTATLFGQGFWPNETVTLSVSQLIYGMPGPSEQWTVVADSLGSFASLWHVCNCPFDSLIATANGTSSNLYAEVRFTDAPRTDTYPFSFATFSSSATYCQGATASNLSASWTNTTCNGTNSGGNTNVSTTITWYKNSVNSTSGGTAVQTTNTNAGTTTSSYTPPTTVAGTLYYYVVVSWSAGPNCVAAGSITTSSTKTVVVNATPATPTVSAGGATTFCQGGSVVLTSSSPTGNQWYQGGVLSGETNQTLSVTTSGSYSVVVTSGTCSSSPSTPITVTVNPNPTASIGIFAPNPSVICSGSSTTIKFSGTANASVSYNKNGTLQSPITLNNGGVFSLSTGALTASVVYDLVGVTSNGCTTNSVFSPGSVTVTVNQPPVITTGPSDQSVTYGAPTNFTVAATGTSLSYQWQADAGSGFANISNLANVYSGVTTPTLNVERPTVAMNNYKYRVIISGVCTPTATSSAATLSVSKASLTVTAENKTKVYGDADPVLSYTPSGTLYYGDTYNVITGVSLSTETGSAATVGTHTIVVSSGGADNYSIQNVNGTLTVSLRSITVAANSKTKVYGAADPVLTYSLSSGSFAYSDTLSGSLSRLPGETVAGSPYAIQIGTLTNTNYTITYSGADLTITTLSVSVTADHKTKVYGALDPSLTFISNPAKGSTLANGDLINFTGSLQRTAGENVGAYAINQGNLDNPNYNIIYTGDSLIISKLAVSVTADPKTKVYGAVDPSLTFVSNPAVGSSLANGGQINFTGAIQRTAGENVGTYAINQGSLDNLNYNIIYTTDSLTITKLAVSVTADPKTKVYGSLDPSLTYVSNPATGSALANGDLISFTGSLQRAIGENIGSYAIKQGTLNNSNYTISYTGDSLTVTKLSVSVTVDPKTKAYGSADPSLTYVSNPAVGSALANGDLITFTGSLQRVAGDTVGTYAINQGSLNNTNYAITYTGANFVIAPAAVATSVRVSPNPQQYSDLATYCAVIKGGAPLMTGGPQAASSVTFKVGTQTIATNVPLIVSGADIIATYSTGLLEPSPYGTLPIGQMAPGTHTVVAQINGANSNYSLTPSQPSTTLTILNENDPVYYTGEEFASTGSATASIAKIHLAASLTDDADGYPGDIRNARVRFKIQPYNCDISMTPQASVYTSWRIVSLVNPSVTTIGTAYLDTTFDIGTCNAKIYDITVEVGGYYTGTSDVVTVSVARSMQDFIAGGGHLNIGSGASNKSSGIYRSSDNSKLNFGFNVKYNKNKTNLQGNANIIIRSNGKTYQVKGIVGGSNGSLNTNTTDPTNKKATLVAKANVTDLATGLTVNYGSNATLELKISDKGEPGVNVDTYGLTIWGSNGSLFYSSNWSTTTNSTIESVINGGNIQVGGTAVAGRIASTGTTTDSVPAQRTVKIYPNPTDKQTIHVSILGDEPVGSAQLYIYDISGKLIHANETFCTHTCNETTFDLDKQYVAGVYLIDVIVDGRIYHQKLIVR